MRDRRPSHRLSLASIPLASPSSYLQPSSLSCLRRFASLAPTVAIPPSPLPTPFSLLPRSSQFLSLLLSVALWLSLLLPSASAGSALYFDSTPQLVQAIDALQVSQDGPLATGEVPSRFFSAALFGVDLYESMIEGFLVYAGDGQFTAASGGGAATYGCGAYDVSTNPSWATLSADPNVQSIILLVQRNPLQGSGCFFSNKVYNAQIAAGGKVVSVLVADEDDDTVVLMTDDERTPQTYISSMFITKSVFGLLMKSQYWDRTDPYAVYVEMEYYLPNPDGRVEMDMLMQILDSSGISLLTSFGIPARVLQYRLLTTMHYWVFEGSKSLCASSTSAQCTSNCIATNAAAGNSPRYYCNTPVTNGVLSGINGSIALQEITRQSCLQEALQNLPASPSQPAAASAYANPQAYWMWSYWESFYANCAYANSTLGRFSDACSSAQITALSSIKGAPTINPNDIRQCVAANLTANSTGYIPFFERLQAQWFQWNPPINKLWLWINQERYDGTSACRVPITEATCGPLSAICYGYSKTDHERPDPPACNWDNQCTFGVMNCTGISTITTGGGGGGVSAGAVVGIIIAFLVCLVAGLYYWHRRQQLKVKMEVDALLKQYLPMDPGATHGVAQGNHKTREQQERRLIQDMDLEDQDMETRDDI